ncbi:MAG: transcriptional regulator with XRE-family HTH domain [Aureispira sp.]|jgi:transcriptional regulator with XRE-family HTH domain
MDIGKQIKAFRKSKDLSQEGLAEKIGMSRSQYSRIEGNKVKPTLTTLEKIAEALEVGMAELFSTQEDIEISSKNSSTLERVRLIEQLDDDLKSSIFKIIDVAISSKRLKDSLKNSLDLA